MRSTSLMGLLAISAAGIVLCARAAGADEVSLYNGSGEAVAYIDMDDDMTIYLWGGKPVAYLDATGADEFNVYGFDGKHLGWFADGVIWGHGGTAACAISSRMVNPQLEPLKGLKELKPLKALQELVLLRPVLTNSFGNTPCEFLLASAASE